ncbi:transcriptional regulator [Algibacter sp.]|uniref:helix-turn-helix and ligand-binding sensor domain-containing protein n=1 Tax=Algibacter sp. TaxID=1872428 RepID=UPI003C74B5F9
MIFALITKTVTAQYTPFFKNYALTDFNVGNQNWGISVSENGKLYVANDKGLVEFDGLKWGFLQLPNKTIIRSVLALKGVIYTGSYQEFGYWQKNIQGELSYTSLSNFKEDELLDEAFWQILPHEDAVLFRSFSNIYIYKKNTITRIKPKSTIISCNKVDGKIYVSTLKDGVFVLENETLIPLINIDEFSEVKVISITKYNNELLITTALRGCFIYDGITLKPRFPEINSLIKEHQLNSFLSLKNNYMAFGTIKNGVYITDSDGNILFHINKENGLLNNTVLCQGLGKDNELWIGLDNGIALIDLNYNHIFYNDNSGELGAVYDIINFKDTIYIGSNTGLFYLEDDILKFTKNSQGQVWDLKEINGELFCGHNSGTYLVQDKTLKKISNFTGGWVIRKVPESDQTFIQGTYTGLVKYTYQNGNWDVTHLGEKNIPIKYFVFEDKYTLWVAHAYKGLFRVKMDSDYENVLEFKNYKDKGLWSDFNVKVHRIKNDICFKTNEGWQKYEPLLDSIIPHILLNKTFGKETNLISNSSTDLLVTLNKNDKIKFTSLIDEQINLELPSQLFQKRLVVGGENISKINDTIHALNLYDGFMLINIKSHQSKKDSLQTPIIERIEIDKELVEINKSGVYQFPFNKNIGISISSPNSKNHYFEYALSNSDAYNWYKMENEKLELSSLSNGKYTIRFRAINTSGQISKIKSLSLEILPPWYKNTYFYLVMSLIIGLVAYGFHKRKIKKEQYLLHQKLKKEQEILLKEKVIENDNKIVQLKNESLKSEVKLKSKQLANTAMALVKKNESMQEIKNELINNETGFKNNSSYNRLLKKIDNSIGHEDEWQLFEYNFNQVHEEFFNQLKSKFPKLTHKDLKICAYIKMNLLTKEIAPLMNVSIRGLETHRYRLKRKLDLDNDKSLSDYLRNFK